MKRREFLKHSATGLAVVAIGSLMPWSKLWGSSDAPAISAAGFAQIDLEMVEVDAEMVDTVRVPMWAFRLGEHEDHDDDNGSSSDDHSDLSLPRIPGPALVAIEGDRIRLRITNHIDRGGDHGFAIPGVVGPVTIPHHGTVEVEFIAPAPGTYMYLDPLNEPVNRVMGLHGALVVLPNPVGGNGTPYRNPTANIQSLFNDLGRTAHFPGHPWDMERNAIWVFSVIDPEKCEDADSSSPISPLDFLNGFLPQYFTLNGKSGFFSAQHHHLAAGNGEDDDDHEHEHEISFAGRTFDLQGNISISGRVGQPILIRSLNAGLAWHSPHIHGNHVYRLTDTNGVLLNNLIFEDTWTLPPMGIVELVLPFVRPPDIPPLAWPPVEERFPLLYPMHDHNEISNTAAGGNYPQGLATHWQIDGDIDPREIVIFVDQADLRVRTGRVELSGHISRTPAQVGQPVILDVHAGGPEGEAITRTIQVDGQGFWSFRGRALKAMDARIVSLMYHDPVDPALVHASRTVPLRVR
jgi:FtsP/CotA-like multicopper oxidase with cupredoxin domain